MSQPLSADQKLEQITETLAVHNLMKGLPEHAQARVRQIALRDGITITELARKAILTFTQPRHTAA